MLFVLIVKQTLLFIVAQTRVLLGYLVGISFSLSFALSLFLSHTHTHSDLPVSGENMKVKKGQIQVHCCVRFVDSLETSCCFLRLVYVASRHVKEGGGAGHELHSLQPAFGQCPFPCQTNAQAFGCWSHGRTCQLCTERPESNRGPFFQKQEVSDDQRFEP